MADRRGPDDRRSGSAGELRVQRARPASPAVRADRAGRHGGWNGAAASWTVKGIGAGALGGSAARYPSAGVAVGGRDVQLGRANRLVSARAEEVARESAHARRRRADRRGREAAARPRVRVGRLELRELAWCSGKALAGYVPTTALGLLPCRTGRTNPAVVKSLELLVKSRGVRAVRRVARGSRSLALRVYGQARCRVGEGLARRVRIAADLGQVVGVCDGDICPWKRGARLCCVPALSVTPARPARFRPAAVRRRRRVAVQGSTRPRFSAAGVVARCHPRARDYGADFADIVGRGAARTWGGRPWQACAAEAQPRRVRARHRDRHAPRGGRAARLRRCCAPAPRASWSPRGQDIVATPSSCSQPRGCYDVLKTRATAVRRTSTRTTSR